MKSPSPRNLFTLWLLAWLGAAAGCIAVPDYVKADMEPPNGQRPNNYGKLIDDGDGRLRVEPDRPTIRAVAEKS